MPKQACDTITEVFTLYNLSPAQERTAWEIATKRWNATSGRFYAYAIAHEIAAYLN